MADEAFFIRDVKHSLLVSEYYAMFTMMNDAVSKYFRITKFKLDIINYVFRNPAKMFTNFVSSLYDLKKIKGEPKFKKIKVFINNQFGPEKLVAEKQKRLCVPSTLGGEAATLNIVKNTVGGVDGTFDFDVTSTEPTITKSITTSGGTGSTTPFDLVSRVTYTTDETTLPADFTLTHSDCTINGHRHQLF